MFGRGQIVNNKIASNHNYNLYLDMVKQTEKQHVLIHWGLIDTLRRLDPDAQEFLNKCDDYPSSLPIGDVRKMEKIFQLLSKRIEKFCPR